MACHPVRLAQGIDRVTIKIGQGGPVHLVRRAAIKFHVTGERHRVGARLGQWFANIHRLDPRQRISMFRHQLREPHQNPPPFGPRGPDPVRAKRPPSRIDRPVDIGSAAACDFPDALPGGRVFYRQPLRARGAGPVTGDEYFRRIEPEVA